MYIQHMYECDFICTKSKVNCILLDQFINGRDLIRECLSWNILQIKLTNVGKNSNFNTVARSRLTVKRFKLNL